LTGQAANGGAVRVRFAPSPTGNLHIGGARTALFNWLFARHNRGSFILRIEDTDRQRSRAEYTQEIMESLEWLGLDYDEGPYFQSERGEIYRKAADLLTGGSRAYPCCCLPEELEARRKEASGRGETFRYDGRCADLSPEDLEEKRRQGIPLALRVRVPPGSTTWKDMVRGEITFDHQQFDDFIIMKSDGTPTYHFAVVVDDVDMAITHVIRGEDHISNTPRQAVLYEALGVTPPQLAHIPLIHGPGGGRLSKRHGATAILDYRRQGFLPEALVNSLALLGWSAGDDRQFFEVEELVDLFDLDRVVRTPAVFDLEKLTWMNSHYLGKLPLPRKTDLLIPYWVEAGLLEPDDVDQKRNWLEGLVGIVGERLKVLGDIVGQTDYFFSEEITPDKKARKILDKAAPQKETFRKIHHRLEELARFEAGPIEKAVREVMDEDSLQAGQVMQPIRAAISGRTATPGLFECLEFLGRERTLARIGVFLLGEAG
jgi:glutamyl-tRNA synthetase